MPTETAAVERVGRPPAVPLACHGQAHGVGRLEGPSNWARSLQIDTAGIEPSGARLVVYSRELEGGTVAARVHQGLYKDIQPTST